MLSTKLLPEVATVTRKEEFLSIAWEVFRLVVFDLGARKGFVVSEDNRLRLLALTFWIFWQCPKILTPTPIEFILVRISVVTSVGAKCFALIQVWAPTSIFWTFREPMHAAVIIPLLPSLGVERISPSGSRRCLKSLTRWISHQTSP